ncbi:hypothetical protein HZS_5099 [Henneguya salminicola]|nr:hypothetical protein HZS_5099 [Henneguya salminicola]
MTPHPSYHSLIVMVYDRGTELYVPNVYALLSAKNEYNILNRNSLIAKSTVVIFILSCRYSEN